MKSFYKFFIYKMQEFSDFFNKSGVNLIQTKLYNNDLYLDSPYYVYIPTVITTDNNRKYALAKNLNIHINYNSDVYCILFFYVDNNIDDILQYVNIFLQQYNISQKNVGIVCYTYSHAYTHVGIARCAIAEFIIKTYFTLQKINMQYKPIIISDDRRYLENTSKNKSIVDLNNKIKDMLNLVMTTNLICSPLGQRCSKLKPKTRDLIDDTTLSQYQKTICRTDTSVAQIIVCNIKNMYDVYLWALHNSDELFCSFFAVLFEDSAFINAAYQSKLVEIRGYTKLKRRTLIGIDTIARNEVDYNSLSEFSKVCLNKAVDISVDNCNKPLNGTCIKWGNNTQQKITSSINDGYSTHYTLLKQFYPHKLENYDDKIENYNDKIENYDDDDKIVNNLDYTKKRKRQILENDKYRILLSPILMDQ